MEVFGFEVVGVDLLLFKRGLLVMEVNVSLGLEGIEGIIGVDVVGVIVCFVEWKYKLRKQQVKFKNKEE